MEEQAGDVEIAVSDWDSLGWRFAMSTARWTVSLLQRYVGMQNLVNDNSVCVRQHILL